MRDTGPDTKPAWSSPCITISAIKKRRSRKSNSFRWLSSHLPARTTLRRGMLPTSDFAKRLLKLVQPTDYSVQCSYFTWARTPLSKSSPKYVMKEYRALGAAVGGSRSQVIFSLILLVKGKGFERTSWIQQINDWLWNGCHIQGFDFLDHGTLRNLVYWGLMGLIRQRGGRASLATVFSSWWREL